MVSEPDWHNQPPWDCEPGMGMHETPRFELGEDETGGPAFFWQNPWTGKREKIANLWWPEHPPQATEAVEQLFSGLELKRKQDHSMSVLDEIAAERHRQTEAEGYDAAHDDAQVNGDIAKAAAAYAVASVRSAIGAQLWPWRIDGFRLKNGRDSLIKAAALCIAEIERLDRARKTEAAD